MSEERKMVEIELDLDQALADHLNEIGERSGLGGGAVATLLLTMKTMEIQEKLQVTIEDNEPDNRIVESESDEDDFKCPICECNFIDSENTEHCWVNGIRVCIDCTDGIEKIETSLGLDLPIKREGGHE